MTKDTKFSSQSPILGASLKLSPPLSPLISTTVAFWNGNFCNSLLIKFLVNDHLTHGLISAFAILSKKLRCIGSAGLSLFVMLVAITVVLRLKIYCNLETVPSTGLFPEEKIGLCG